MMTYSAVSFPRAAARLLALALAVAMPLCGPAWGQGASAPAADPVVAKVAGQPIHLSDLQDALATLPHNAQSMPAQTIMPFLLDQLIDARILVIQARKEAIDKDPAVQRQLAAAEDRVLEAALLHREIEPLVTDAALRARYEKEIAGKTGEEEVHARHILVDDEATAKKIIAELRKGADFAALSKQYSKDPGASQQGGDLGFFKKGDMVPEFSDAAFSLKDGEVTPTPVHTQFGWHVIQVIERRQAAAGSFETARNDLRQKVIQETVQAAVARAQVGIAVEKFNLDGSPIRATDSAQPPPPK